MTQKHTEHQQEQQAQGENAMQHDANKNQKKELQQQQSNPSVEKIKATWKQQLGSSKLEAPKLLGGN